jgi:hypothetical protein
MKRKMISFFIFSCNGAPVELNWQNLPQFHIFHHKSHMTDPGSNPDLRGERPATNRLTHDTANMTLVIFSLVGAGCLNFRVRR